MINSEQVSVKLHFICNSDLISSTLYLFLHPLHRWPIKKKNILSTWAFEGGILSANETKVKRFFRSLHSVKTWFHFLISVTSLSILCNNDVSMQNSSQSPSTDRTSWRFSFSTRSTRDLKVSSHCKVRHLRAQRGLLSYQSTHFSRQVVVALRQLRTILAIPSFFLSQRLARTRCV